MEQRHPVTTVGVYLFLEFLLYREINSFKLRHLFLLDLIVNIHSKYR